MFMIDKILQNHAHQAHDQPLKNAPQRVSTKAMEIPDRGWAPLTQPLAPASAFCRRSLQRDKQ